MHFFLHVCKHTFLTAGGSSAPLLQVDTASDPRLQDVQCTLYTIVKHCMAAALQDDACGERSGNSSSRRPADDVAKCKKLKEKGFVAKFSIIYHV